MAVHFSTDYLIIILLIFVTAFNNCFFYSINNYFLDCLYALCAAVTEVGIFFFLAIHLKRFKNLAYWLFFILASIDFLLDLGNYMAKKELFTVESLFLMLGTNKQEASDFFELYFPTWKLVIVAGTMILLYMLFFLSVTLHKHPGWCIKNRKARNIAWANVALWVLCLGILLANKKYITFGAIFPGQYMHMMYRFEPSRDLREYQHPVQLEETTQDHPKIILCIVGESFAKSHSSIYGYEKETNPELKKLQTSGNLYAFTQCEAPDIYTAPAFKSIMSTYQTSHPAGRKWYECETFYDIFHAAYFIYWLSNQSSYGVYDCVQVSYSMLCDSIWFPSQEQYEDTYDDVLIPVIQSLADKTSERPPFFIVNLMGQHENYENRYPSTWTKFKPTDYTNETDNQRWLISQYDNATLYNDYIVASILRIFEDEEVLAFYFPDHGMDIFETDPEVCGHARGTDPKSVATAREIPFFIYMSDLYKERHPSQIQMVQESIDKPFNTENFIYTLMDIAGWKFEGNNDVRDFSLFSK